MTKLCAVAALQSCGLGQGIAGALQPASSAHRLNVSDQQRVIHKPTQCENAEQDPHERSTVEVRFRQDQRAPLSPHRVLEQSEQQPEGCSRVRIRRRPSGGRGRTHRGPGRGHRSVTTGEPTLNGLSTADRLGRQPHDDHGPDDHGQDRHDDDATDHRLVGDPARAAPPCELPPCLGRVSLMCVAR